jgi:hypothetical protein
MWNVAGFFARGIIFVLAIMSIISLTVAGAKWWRFRKSMRQTRKFAPEFARWGMETVIEEHAA